MAPMYAPVAPVPKLSNVMVAVAVASAAATENRRKTLIPLNLDMMVSSLFYSPGKCNKYTACAVALARMGKRNSDSPSNHALI